MSDEERLAMWMSLTDWLACAIAAVPAAQPELHAVPGAAVLRQQPIMTKVLELIERRQARAADLIHRARTLLDGSDAVAAGAAIDAARRCQQEAWRAMRRVEWLLPDWEPAYLALVRVRILRVNLMAERLPANARPRWRRLSRFIGKVLDYGGITLDAQILEKYRVGKFHDRGRHRTWMFSARKPELRQGQTIGITYTRRSTGIRFGKQNEGQEYWVVVDPPYVSKAAPGIQRYVVFAMRATRRRRL